MMSTGAEFEKQNAEQESDETFSGKPVQYRAPSSFEPALDAGHGERTDATPNDK